MKISQKFWYIFIGVFKGHNQIGSILAFIMCDECNCCSLIASTTGSANTVHIIFNMIWAHVIHDKLDMAYIKTSSTNTCSYHNIPDLVFKILYKSFSINLVLASMENNSFIPNFIQLFKKIISFNLFVNEDKNTSFLLPFT